MGLSTIFGRKPTAPDEQGESVEAAWMRREAELLDSLHCVNAKLQDVGDKIKKFRREHFVLIDSQVVLRAKNFAERPVLAQAWHELIGLSWRLERERSAILQEWSGVKSRLKTMGVTCGS